MICMDLPKTSQTLGPLATKTRMWHLLNRENRAQTKTAVSFCEFSSNQILDKHSNNNISAVNNRSWMVSCLIFKTCYTKHILSPSKKII